MSDKRVVGLGRMGVAVRRASPREWLGLLMVGGGGVLMLAWPRS
jgi:hypothetical protein